MKLQRNVFEDEEIREIFQNAVSRIKAIAIIHEKLYQSGSFDSVNVGNYIKHLTDYIINVHYDEKRAFNCIIDIKKDLEMSLNTSITAGLIINEAIINCIKHAFSEKALGDNKEIRVSLILKDRGYKLKISDNGKGFPEDILDNSSKYKTLGLKIISTLIKQLQGELSLYNDSGAVYEIIFSDKQL